MIKILAACGCRVLTQTTKLKVLLKRELSNRSFDVHCDAVMVKDVNEDLIKVMTSSHQLLQQILVLTQVFQLSKLDNLIPYPSNECSSI